MTEEKFTAGSDIPSQDVSDIKCDRRLFLSKSAKAILLATATTYASAVSAKTATEEFGLDKMKADTERQDEQYVDPLDDSQRVGIAIVGLGDLSIKKLCLPLQNQRSAKLSLWLRVTKIRA